MPKVVRAVKSEVLKVKTITYERLFPTERFGNERLSITIEVDGVPAATAFAFAKQEVLKSSKLYQDKLKERRKLDEQMEVPF